MNIKKFIKTFIRKIRIFKRIKAHKAVIVDLNRTIELQGAKIHNLEIRIKKTTEASYKMANEYDTKIEKIQTRHDKASKHIAEAVRRRNEFLKRLESKMPDDMMSTNFEDYKFWLAEPFIKVDFIPFKPDIDERKVHIDKLSTLRGLDNIFKVVVPKDDKDKV